MIRNKLPALNRLKGEFDAGVSVPVVESQVNAQMLSLDPGVVT